MKKLVLLGLVSSFVFAVTLDKLECKIVGKNIIVKGTNKFRKINSNVKIIYNNETAITSVDNNHKYKIILPLKSKINNIAVIQIDNSYEYCPILKSNIKKQDKIYHNVNNMTAEICLVNPDRTSKKVTYKYKNNSNKVITREGYIKNRKLCFKVPLKYNRVHSFAIKQLDGTWKSHLVVINDLPTNFVRIRMTFNCDSDVDLHILEPNNKEVYSLHRKNYGKLDVNSQKASQGPENYVLDTTIAPKGRYYYWVEWYSRKNNFKKYYNKNCSGNLEIIKNGQVTLIPFIFFNVNYTSDRYKQKTFSTYPASKKNFYFEIK